jgi:two-component system sensor histidine kinase HydH
MTEAKNPQSRKVKFVALAAVTAVTLGVHYGWLVEPIFGHVHWLHAVHGRFCYIPIVMAAAWFGLRGGLLTATAISLLLIPYIVGVTAQTHDLAQELAEIVFYFAIAVLAGVLVEREHLTRREQQETQLHLERSQKLSLLGQIAAGVAHEIKNPLASIKGAADILTDDETSSAEREEFKGILRSEVRRIDAIVTEFLDFARPKDVRLRKLDLTEAVRASLRQIEAHAKRVGLSIETHLQDDVLVDGDPEKLHQMILNLMLNAIQASDEGGKISVVLESRDGRMGVLTIADYGEGISASHMEHIFEPFFTTKGTGTGLGLAVVKDIADRHSGEIRIESVEGAGTKAIVSIPLWTGQRQT